jgi:hypothetical protein
MKNIMLLVAMLSCISVYAQRKDYPIQPVAFTHVHVNDNFWKPKMQVNANITIPYILKMCREHGRIDNFLAAAGKRVQNFHLTIRMCING